MKQKIVYIGLDVDDTQYHGSALNKETGEFLNFKCRPTLKGLLGQLAKVRKHFPRHIIKVKVACAREMVEFVWESLRLAAA